MKINKLLIMTFLLAVTGLLPITATAMPVQPSQVDQSSVNGKYANLVQQLDCPKDAGKYGDFYDYGYWKGGNWCGQKGLAGYWVWLKPNWYVWKTKN